MFHVKHFLFNVERKWLHFLDLGGYNSLMATKPDTQPVPTPALSTLNIRQTLNPLPPKNAGTAEFIWWGYNEAMLDSLLTEYKEGDLDPRDFVTVVREVLDYKGCEWHSVGWDEQGIQTLQIMTDEIIEMDYEV